MTADGGESAPHASADAPTDVDRERLLAMLNDAIEEAHRKVTNGRVYDAENERARQGWLRELGYLVKVYNQVTNDKRLDELAEEIERLKEAQERAKYR